jgi:enterobactin synthetase component D
VEVEPFVAPRVAGDGVHIYAVETTSATQGGETPRHAIVPLPPTLLRAAPARLASFATGRFCASRALRDAGYSGASALAIGLDAGPIWPDGFVGSITHTHGLAAAAAAPRTAMRAVGIDCELVMTASAAHDIGRIVFPEAGMALNACGSLSSVMEWRALVTVVFSAKESLYKCLRPLVGVFFEFADARVVAASAGRGTLKLRLLRDLSQEFCLGTEFDASFTVAGGVVWTAVTLAAADGAVVAP